MKKNKISIQHQEKLIKKKEADEALRKQLVIAPDELIGKRGEDKALDQRIEKVDLINNTVIDLRKLSDFIGKRNKYKPRFPQKFYLQIFRLNGWKVPANGKIKDKPSIVAVYTILYIYGRFPKEILPQLQSENRIFEEIGMRLYKHFQFLTPEGLLKLDLFINNSVAIMERCNNWDEFVREHAKAYGKPFQSSLFN